MTATVDALLAETRPSHFDRWCARVRHTPVLRRRIDVLAPVFVTLLAAVLRLWNLGHPHALVFDETYYVKDAWSQWNLGYPADWPSDADKGFVAGATNTFLDTGSFVVHPPLGKWFIGLGMWLFGPDSSVGWRIAAALFGTATVLLVYLLARRLTRSTVFATVAGLLMAIDGLGIVLSRVSLLDIFLTFFSVLAVLFLVYDHEWHRIRLARRLGADPERSPWGPVLWGRPWLLAAGAAAGAATAVKWSGLYTLAAIGIYVVVSDALARRRVGLPLWPWGALAQGAASFVLLVPIAVIVYLASWTGWLVTDGGYDRHAADAAPATGLFAWVPLTLQSLWIYHQAIYAFHVGLTTPHSYASPAWQWPLPAADLDVLASGSGGAERMLVAEHLCAVDLVDPEPDHLVGGDRRVGVPDHRLHPAPELATRGRAHRAGRRLPALVAVPRADDLPVLHDRDAAVHGAGADVRACARSLVSAPRRSGDGSPGSGSCGSSSSWSSSFPPSGTRCGRPRTCRTSSGCCTTGSRAGSERYPRLCDCPHREGRSARDRRAP
ncbi:dolichyl-phosphate-mannose--protein mannosyltransferase [Microbacterium elymi]|uniref:Polyprenol-phosphate-mannose--protein mannosyltransferase n=1 Tax=Microbacterium elymi TaxID=2909587 RepID=A0ABY5NKB5_9MICO|nr:phospholipid carrier-dependent glycosyltransferase [Microbacterium elymi]UUT35613.1 phospholipid carrier-dependent glycosyltransferase [Microbacterium elymi]